MNDDDEDEDMGPLRITNLKYAWMTKKLKKKKTKSVKQPKKKKKLNAKKSKTNKKMRRIDSYFSPNTLRNISESRRSNETESSDSTITELLPLKPLYTQRIINEQKKQQNVINIPLNDENKHQHIQAPPQISNVSFLSSSMSSNIGHSNHERNDDYDN